MSNKNEPAFPVQDCAAYQYHGLSMRDYMATHVAIGLIAATSYSSGTSSKIMQEVAEDSYRLADALLIERERGQ